MSKEDQYQNMVPSFVKLFNRYTKEVLHENSEEMERKASEIYKKYYEATPKIGGANNPMASNLYEFMTCVAYFEASDNRINVDSIDTILGWMLDSYQTLGKFVNFNGKLTPKIMNLMFKYMASTTSKHKNKGEWGNTWDLLYNPENHQEGSAYRLIGCPLLAFAKANGYEDIMPKFCAIDHASAKMMHAKLIRLHTEALGGEYCDYWFVGDESEEAKKYADLPKI